VNAESPWEPQPIVSCEQVTVGLLELASEVYEERHLDRPFDFDLFLKDVAESSVWDHRTDPVFFPTSRCSAYQFIRTVVEAWRPLILLA